MHLQTFKITSLFHAEKKFRILARSVKRLDGLNFGEIRFVSPAKLFGSDSGRVRAGFRPKVDKNGGLNSAWEVFFVLGAQKYNQNNLATLLKFSNLS